MSKICWQLQSLFMFSEIRFTKIYSLQPLSIIILCNLDANKNKSFYWERQLVTDGTYKTGRRRVANFTQLMGPVSVHSGLKWKRSAVNPPNPGA